MASVLRENQTYRISLNTLVASDRFINEIRELERYNDFISEEEGSGYYVTFILNINIEDEMGSLMEFMLDILQVIERNTINRNFIFTTVCLSLITKFTNNIENIETVVVVRRNGVFMKHKFYSDYLDRMKVFIFNMKLAGINLSFLDWSE